MSEGPSPEEQSGEHPRIAAFRSVLETRGGRGRVVVLPASVHTGQLAADALGCDVGAIANSLLFRGVRPEGKELPVLVLTSGAHRVDTDHVAGAAGLSALRRGDPAFVEQHTGQVIGGVSPIGHPAPVLTYLDRALAAYDEIWAAAGHPAAVFSTTYDELLRLTGAIEIEVR
jgi:prolyl-tRNA editing enzyme YbaK/EbsC (Cys-tRNA(Pro) deacylase)